MNRLRLIAGIAGIIALFAACTTVMLYLYPRAYSVMSLVSYLLPVACAALFFGVPGGLTTALGAVAATTTVVFFHNPESTVKSAWLAAFVFCGAGVLLGYLAHMYKKLARTSRRLKESEESYRLLFHRVPVGLYRTTREGSIVEANEALTTMLGYSGEAALIGKNSRHFYAHPSQRNVLLSMLDENTTIKDFEAQLIRTDGRQITALISVQRVPDNNERKAVYQGSITDVTDKRKLEEQRAIAESQRQRAEHMSAIAELAAGVAHDINNILAVIKGQTEGISITSALNHRQQKAVEQILSGVDRVSSVIDGLLATVGSHLVSPRNIDLGDVVRDSFVKATGRLEQSICLSISIADCPLPVFLDPHTIERCVDELIQNAVRATGDAGHIEVSCEIEPIQHDALHSVPVDASAESYVCISICDDGVGIDNRIINRIFEPYFTTQEFGSGAGIGLTVVYGLVTQQNGLVGVQSSQGDGTTVKLYFPIIPSA